MTGNLLRTPLANWHAAHGARMVDFAGWWMPVQYSSIVDEHRATRSAVGIFDISHMGRLRLAGSDAESFLDRLLTRRVIGIAPNRIRYSLITNEDGGVLDDVLVYSLVGEAGRYYFLVVNAGNRAKIVAWIARQLGGADVTVSDVTLDTAMIAVQGPSAVATAASVVRATDLERLRYYEGRECGVSGSAGWVSRTGYTGEDGFEFIVEAAAATAAWESLHDASVAAGGAAVGLGARDTLRLEAGMPLYGHELSESLNPFQADLGFAVQLKDRRFIGSEALEVLQRNRQLPRRVGLESQGRRACREGYPVYFAGKLVGEVTSGTFSPSLERPIAMAYVQPEATAIGTELEVDIRGKREPAWVVKLPFYSREQG